MTQDLVITIIQQAIMTIFLVSAPPLLMGLIVGLLVSIFQAVTSIQEPTLAFVPKIVAVLLSFIMLGPFMLSTLQDFFSFIFVGIPEFIRP